MNTAKTISGAALSLFISACGSDDVTSTARGGDGRTADAAADGITVQTYTSSGTGAVDLQVNSHLVLGPTQALLVDAQFLVTDAQAVADMVTRSGRALTTVLLTHAHSDHYAGLAVIQAAFPSAAIVTTPGVLADFQANAPTALSEAQSTLGNLIASTLVTPAALAADAITLDGVAPKVLEMPNAGESAHGAALVLPGGALVTGDLLYDDVHLQLGECHSQGWQQNLDAVQASGFVTFYPGHGKSPVDGSVFAAVTSYIAGAVPLLRAAGQGDAGAGDGGDPRGGAAVAQIAASFPSFASKLPPGILDELVHRREQVPVTNISVIEHTESNP